MGTCNSHPDIHAFTDECIGWRDYPLDKDRAFLNLIDEMLFNGWKDGQVTNEFRSHMAAVIDEVRDWL